MTGIKQENCTLEEATDCIIRASAGIIGVEHYQGEPFGSEPYRYMYPSANKTSSKPFFGFSFYSHGGRDERHQNMVGKNELTATNRSKLQSIMAAIAHKSSEPFKSAPLEVQITAYRTSEDFWPNSELGVFTNWEHLFGMKIRPATDTPTTPVFTIPEKVAQYDIIDKQFTINQLVEYSAERHMDAASIERETQRMEAIAVLADHMKEIAEDIRHTYIEGITKRFKWDLSMAINSSIGEQNNLANRNRNK